MLQFQKWPFNIFFFKEHSSCRQTKITGVKVHAFYQKSINSFQLTLVVFFFMKPANNFIIEHFKKHFLLSFFCKRFLKTRRERDQRKKDNKSATLLN